MDNSYEQRKQAIIDEITAAFDGVSREDGISLHEAMVIDNYGNDEERAEVRAQDTEARWQDVPDEDIGWSDAVLNFLDAKGFRYYLPAFIVWYLKYVDIPNDWNDKNFQSLISDLTIHPIRLSRPDDIALSVYKRLTEHQSKAIAHFLVFEAEREAAWEAECRAEDEEQWKKMRVASGEMSSEEADASLERVKQARASSGFVDNQALSALSGWWRQFL